ncbi:MAG: sulfatase-like hydrolase/transferase [Planctomycetaceae bacterium]|nr:sulfatase-like hydrolase/transferase [Planctomycetaceae bacterium]
MVFTNDNGGQTALTASNAPLRGKKGQLWEGGVRVPLVMRWPGVIQAEQVCDEPVISLDFLPTFLAAADAMPLADVSLDGVNLLPLLKGEISSLPERSLHWRNQGPRGPISIRRGPWKLIHQRGDSPTPELYNLDDDIAETRDVAAEHPELVGELSAAMQIWEQQLVDPLWGGRGGARTADAAPKKNSSPRKKRQASGNSK